MLVLIAMPLNIFAGSVWDKAYRNSRPLYSDDTAGSIGDNLTIEIHEKSIIANDTKRDLNKKSDRSADVSGSISFVDVMHQNAGGNTYKAPTVKASSKAETDFEGEAKFDSERSVIDQITVTVQDVLPNGNLVVLGTRQREVNGDVQIIEISGIVRTGDITFYNTVSSEKVGNFQLVYRHKGQENSFTEPGWLDHALNLLNPW